MSRPYTTEIFNMMDEGMITAEQVAQMCLLYMSEDEVKDMMISNDITMEFTNDWYLCSNFVDLYQRDMWVHATAMAFY